MTGAALYYGDNRDYAVELHDLVDLRFEGAEFSDAEVRRIHPRLRKVTVRFDDFRDVGRSTAEPRRRTVRVPVSAVDLIARDG